VTKRIKPVSRPIQKTIFLIFVIVLACDSFEQEEKNQIKFLETEFYVLPTSSIIIDLKSVLEKSFVNASLMITEEPTKGTLTMMAAAVWKYTPNADFIDGDDQFAFSAMLPDGTLVKGNSMLIHMKKSEAELPCGVYPVEDNIWLRPATSAVVHVSKNDHICGVNEYLDAFIHLPPKFGEAVIAGDSITYTPGPYFSEGDELVYGLSTRDGKRVFFGLVLFTKGKLEVFDVRSALTTVFFVNDTVGFIGGENVLQKTTDGGRHWSSVNYPTNHFGDTNFEEIYFLDSDVGFAALSNCSSAIGAACSGGWMSTKDGGKSWTRTDLFYPAVSITFPSPQIGFLTTVYHDDWDGVQRFSLFKTVDGGETWNNALTSFAKSGNLKVEFANDSVGYVYQDDYIFSTTNGGTTWTTALANGTVTSFTLVSDGATCASLSYDAAPARLNSKLVRSEDGVMWNPMTTVSYHIVSQDFSPRGDLGVMVGIGGPKTESDILIISRSADLGKTWVHLNKQLVASPLAISVPSSNVAYILCSNKIIKYTP
jgi:hypothetical protein